MDAVPDELPSAQSASLFERVLGPAAFAALPLPVQALHGGVGRQCWQGQGQVERGRHPLAVLMAWAARLPPTGTVPVTVTFDRAAGRERWHRQFGTHVMASTLWQRRALLRERLGLVTFDFALAQDDATLDWQVRAVRALGVPLPLRWFGGVQARESADGARYRFLVDVRLPGVGLLVRYDGWLLPVGDDD
ncbi:protein of unknown function [Pseudoxanthomonas sp. GM95]|uniref:DUF4166 domain-containing protein n=1 Tax=Pseudoxanthomonas sp. GM95 TaxID=1881043 RepID=UPI0008CA1277|nr:DUF4166 domain-containing protein [Pseudoxanthomonas sp. GM95]SEL67068.1 protein of unknown function [Pseudoxanthomonas sp. GM95]